MVQVEKVQGRVLRYFVGKSKERLTSLRSGSAGISDVIKKSESQMLMKRFDHPKNSYNSARLLDNSYSISPPRHKSSGLNSFRQPADPETGPLEMIESALEGEVTQREEDESYKDLERKTAFDVLTGSKKLMQKKLISEYKSTG